MIRAQAARRPEAVALVACDEMTDIRARSGNRIPFSCGGCGSSPGPLTYGDLDQRANMLAHELRLRGFGPGSLVGIYLDRSVEMGIAVLGVLESGAACPARSEAIPKTPALRTRPCASGRRGLTHRMLRLPVLAGTRHAARSFYVDADETSLASFRDRRSERQGCAPDHLAYCIYTSGLDRPPRAPW